MLSPSTSRPRPLVFALALLAGAAHAQAPPGHATTSPIRPDQIPAVMGADDLGSASPSDAERAVSETVQGDGVHVVHLWAPWCGNSTAGLETGWYEVVEAHPDVSFTFVTVRNDGEDGAETLRQYGIPDTATVLAHPGRFGEDTTFLGRPITWTPATWVFNRGGRLAYAFNYGEVSADMLRTAIEHARAGWDHD